jgi:hypothetical protein
MAGGLFLNADWSSLAGIYVEVKDAKGTQEIALFTQRRITRLPECGRSGTGMRAEMRVVCKSEETSWVVISPLCDSMLV